MNVHKYQIIREVDTAKILHEVSDIEYDDRILLQGTHESQDPFELIGKSLTGESLEETRKRVRDMIEGRGYTNHDIDVPLFDTPYINSLMSELNLFYTRLMRLPPGKCYPSHTDTTVRVHIPIVTNEDNFFIIEDEIIRLPVGSAYRIDTTRTHTFVNASTKPRVHMIGIEKS